MHSQILCRDQIEMPRPAWSPRLNPAPARAVQGEGRTTAPILASDSLLTRVLDELDYGVVLVTPDARLRFANRVALGWFAGNPCVSLVTGHVRMQQDRADVALRKACAEAADGRRSLVTSRSGAARVSIAVVPVNDPCASEPAPAVLLVIGRRRVCEPLSVEFFAREHKVTGAETAVLRGLCGGVTPAEIARQAGVAVSTVRTQIGSLRLKTGARNIADLVLMVTLLPPIVAVF